MNGVRIGAGTPGACQAGGYPGSGPPACQGLTRCGHRRAAASGAVSCAPAARERDSPGSSRGSIVRSGLCLGFPETAAKGLRVIGSAQKPASLLVGQEVPATLLQETLQRMLASVSAPTEMACGLVQPDDVFGIIAARHSADIVAAGRADGVILVPQGCRRLGAGQGVQFRPWRSL